MRQNIPIFKWLILLNLDILITVTVTRSCQDLSIKESLTLV